MTSDSKFLFVFFGAGTLALASFLTAIPVFSATKKLACINLTNAMTQTRSGIAAEELNKIVGMPTTKDDLVLNLKAALTYAVNLPDKGNPDASALFRANVLLDLFDRIQSFNYEFFITEQGTYVFQQPVPDGIAADVVLVRKQDGKIYKTYRVNSGNRTKWVPNFNDNNVCRPFK